jgi:hypothetical protein
LKLIFGPASGKNKQPAESGILNNYVICTHIKKNQIKKDKMIGDMAKKGEKCLEGFGGEICV